MAVPLASNSSCPENNAGNLPLANTGQLQQRLASLAHQLAGLQQHSDNYQRQFGLPNSSMTSALQAAYPVDPMHEYAERPGVLGRTTTNAGAVLLRTLSTRNPRVLALAAAAAKAVHGTPEHAAVLAALKDEVMQATGKGPAAEANSAPAGAGHAFVHSPAMRPPASQSAAAADQELDPQLQQQPLTQDALWAALMAKAAARTGPSGSNHSSPQLQPKQQQQPSPKPPLPGHGSADSGMEVEGTSCALPWALLQAAQQAQQEEEEKDAAAAAAAAAADASAAEAAAAEAAAAAAAASGSASAMAVDAAEASAESPKHTKSGSGSLMRSNSTVVFKRRNLSNSNALQKHFSKPAPQHPALQSIARTMSEVPSVPKPQHTFKKQTKKKPLVMRGNSSSNLAVLQQLSRQQQQQQQGASPSAYAAEPECSAETGTTAAAGSYMTQAMVDNGPTMSNVSLRAPAVTAPAAIGTAGVPDVLSFLESREKQLQMLQEQLHMQRCRMAPPSSTGQPRQAMSGFSGGVGGGFPGTPSVSASGGIGSPMYSNNTAAAISELQRLLGGMAAAAGPNSAAAAAAAAAGVTGLQPPADAYEDVQMTDYELAGYDAAAATAALLAQARRRLAQQQQQQQQQQYQAAQQYASQEPAPAASAPTLSTIKALAAALAANKQQQQFQQQPAPPAPAAGYAGSAAGNADLLRKLAAALHPRN